MGAKPRKHDFPDGVICPSRIVYNILEDYEVKIPKCIIPTGIRVDEFLRDDISKEEILELREQLGIREKETMLLSLSRISSEKNIQAILKHLPSVISENPNVKLVVVGDGPYLGELKELTKELNLEKVVTFTGMIPHDDVALYYKACDFFISASTSETQGLTYIESIASGKPIIAHGNPYLDDLINNKMFGTLYYYESDLADAILDAIADTPKMEKEKLQDKMYEISAEHFGKSVYAFYLDVLISEETRKQEKFSLTVKGSAADRSIKLAKSAVSLPSRAVKVTAQSSAKAVKAPKRLINSIRDFLD